MLNLVALSLEERWVSSAIGGSNCIKILPINVIVLCRSGGACFAKLSHECPTLRQSEEWKPSGYNVLEETLFDPVKT